MNYQAIRIIILLAIGAGAMFIVGELHRTGPQAKEATWDDKATRQPSWPIKVDARGGFHEATLAAVDLWNEAAGFKLLVLGVGGVVVMPDDGTPCGDPWRPKAEWDHHATAYQCDVGWEILISYPGDSHKQFCLVAHELGHVLGLAHDAIGVMATGCADMVRVTDKDRTAIRARFRPTTTR